MKKTIIICGIALTLTACGNSLDEPLLVDGAKNPEYNTDHQACSILAENHTKSNVKGSAITGAVIGGVIGGVDSEDGNRADDALVGAVVGGALGAAEGASEQNKERRNILIRCMQGRGHKILA